MSASARPCPSIPPLDLHGKEEVDGSSPSGGPASWRRIGEAMGGGDRWWELAANDDATRIGDQVIAAIRDHSVPAMVSYTSPKLPTAASPRGQSRLRERPLA